MQELSLTKLELRVMKTQELQNWVSLMEGVPVTHMHQNFGHPASLFLMHRRCKRLPSTSEGG
eukprot:1366266-Amphidinium_carterae.1